VAPKPSLANVPRVPMVADSRKVMEAVSGLLKTNWSAETMTALPDSKMPLKDVVAAQVKDSAVVKAGVAAGRPSLLFFVSSATAQGQANQPMPTRAARDSAWMNDRFFGIQPDSAHFILASSVFQTAKVDVAGLDDNKDGTALMQSVPMVVIVDSKGQVLGALRRGNDVATSGRILFSLMAAGLDSLPGRRPGSGSIELNKFQTMFGNLVVLESNIDINRSQDTHLNRFRSYVGVPQQQKQLGDVRSRMEYDSKTLKGMIQQQQDALKQSGVRSSAP
jgi:hypothetical protein